MDEIRERDLGDVRGTFVYFEVPKNLPKACYALFEGNEPDNAEGVEVIRPGLRGTSYPGFLFTEWSNPERVEALFIHGQ